MSGLRRAVCHPMCAAGALMIALISPCITSRADTPGEVKFNRDIHPILSENCFACHGPDARQRKSELRLDKKEGLFAKAKHAVAVVPGEVAKSELATRVSSADPDEVMPPPKTGKKLSPQQIELLKRWIQQGAKWEGHWAYSAPLRPAVPQVKRAEWVRNPIDAFVLARLEAEGMNPSPQAD
jgi:hypothetical protein